jgi:hypothetical protein
MPRDPQAELYEDLRRDVPNVTLVGDAKAPRDIQVAVREGHFAARAIA